MKKLFLLLAIILFVQQKLQAQVIISDKEEPITESSINAVLEVLSNKTGVLIPKLSKIRIKDKLINHEGEMFFSEDDNCLMINVANENLDAPEWKCIANKAEVIPKN